MVRVAANLQTSDRAVDLEDVVQLALSHILWHSPNKDLIRVLGISGLLLDHILVKTERAAFLAVKLEVTELLAQVPVGLVSLATDAHKGLVELLVGFFENFGRLIELNADQVGHQSSKLVAAVLGLR